MNLSEQINTIETLLSKNDFHLPEKIYNIYGLTSKTSQTFLNNICSNKNVLEIGTFYGASTFAMAYNNNSTVLTVDNWEGTETIPVNSVFKKKMIFSAKDHFLEMKKNFSNIEYIEGDIFHQTTYQQLITKKFDIIYYDGPHDVESIIKFIMLYQPLFKECIVIFDDYNFESVKIGIDLSMNELKMDYKYKKEIITQGESKDTFWNGIGLFVF
jgi:hypothetical protein